MGVASHSSGPLPTSMLHQGANRGGAQCQSETWLRCCERPCAVNTWPPCQTTSRGAGGCHHHLRPILSRTGSVLPARPRGQAVASFHHGLGRFFFDTTPMQRASAPIQKQAAHAGPANVGPELPRSARVCVVRRPESEAGPRQWWSRSDPGLRKISGCSSDTGDAPLQPPFPGDPALYLYGIGTVRQGRMQQPTGIYLGRYGHAEHALQTWRCSRSVSCRMEPGVACTGQWQVEKGGIQNN
jgi:hypothetical protein